MNNIHEPSLSALKDFRNARRKADLQELLASLSGRSARLFSFEEVRNKLKAVKDDTSKEIREIPLSAIIGSVGRYNDFTRGFLPRKESDERRWAKVKNIIMTKGLSPIQVYQVDEVYFVVDGHHRVSIARQMEAETILAHVTEFHTKAALSPEDQPEDLIIKAEYVNFLERSQLDKKHPKADLRVSTPGQYQEIEDQVEIHRYTLSQKRGADIPFQEAAADWYEKIYTPALHVIRERGILRDFPGRTETDLYLWVCEHRQALEEELDWEIETEKATIDLATQFSPTPARRAARAGSRILEAVLPDEIVDGPPAGQWRRQWADKEDRLFKDILVAITGEESGWRALDQAVHIAKQEGSLLRGLHVVASKSILSMERYHDIKIEFEHRCKQAGVSGELAIDVGRVARRINQRARWTDLVTLSVNYPPAPEPMARLSSGLSAIIRRCPRPLLMLPGTASELARPLLAYDGSPKSQEALYIATYLSARYDIQLIVLKVQEAGRTSQQTLVQAHNYLKNRGGKAILVEMGGQVAEGIKQTAVEYECDLIIMGGYGYNPVVEIALGSTVDEVLRASKWPVLICR